MSGSTKKRKSYSPAYRRAAAHLGPSLLVIDTGRSIAHVAKEIGVGEAVLGRWVAVKRAKDPAPPGALDADEQAELESLVLPACGLSWAEGADDVAARGCCSPPPGPVGGFVGATGGRDGRSDEQAREARVHGVSLGKGCGVERLRPAGAGRVEPIRVPVSRRRCR